MSGKAPKHRKQYRSAAKIQILSARESSETQKTIQIHSEHANFECHRPPRAARGLQGSPGAPRGTQGHRGALRQPPGAARSRQGHPETPRHPGSRQEAASKRSACQKHCLLDIRTEQKRTGQLPQQLCRPSGSDSVDFGHLHKLFLEIFFLRIKKMMS